MTYTPGEIILKPSNLSLMMMPWDLHQMLLYSPHKEVFSIHSILNKYRIPLEVLHRFASEVDWHAFTSFQPITNLTVQQFSGYLNWNLLLQGRIFTEEQISLYLMSYAPWPTICETQVLSEDFIERHRLIEVCQYQIMVNQALSDDFIEKYLDFISADALKRAVTCRALNLREDLMVKVAEKAGWDNILHSDLNHDFIIKYVDKFNPYCIVECVKTSQPLIDAITDSLSETPFTMIHGRFYDRISAREPLPIDFIERHFNELNREFLRDNRRINQEELKALLDKFDTIREVSNA